MVLASYPSTTLFRRLFSESIFTLPPPAICCYLCSLLLTNYLLSFVTCSFSMNLSLFCAVAKQSGHSCWTMLELQAGQRVYWSVYDLGSAAAPASCQHPLVGTGADLPLLWFLDSFWNQTHPIFWIGHWWDLNPNTKVSIGSFEILLSLTYCVLFQNKYVYSLNLFDFSWSCGLSACPKVGLYVSNEA